MTLPEFWTDAHSAERQRVRRMRDLYEGNHLLTLHTEDGGWQLPIYTTHNWLGDRLTRTLSTLQWLEMPRFTVQQAGRQADWDAMLDATRLLRHIYAMSDERGYSGYATLKLSWSSRFRAPRIRRWGEQVGEFTYWEREPGGEPYAVTFYRDEVVPEYRGRKSAVVRVGERFELDGAGAVLVTNRAYLANNGIVSLNDPVALSVVSPDVEIPVESVLRMPMLPACALEADGLRSHYTPSLISLQKSQTRLMSQRDLAIVINEMPVMNVPVRCINPDGTLDLGKFWVTMREPGESAEDQVPINFNNWSGNLSESARQYEINDEQFYALTGLSPALDGKSAGAGESGYARRLGLTKVAAAITQGRHAWGDVWAWAAAAVPAFMEAIGEGSTAFGRGPIEGVVAQWAAPIPEDPVEIAQVTSALYSGGGLSLEQFVRRNNPSWDDEQVLVEVTKIQAERGQMAGAGLGSFGMIPAA